MTQAVASIKKQENTGTIRNYIKNIQNRMDVNPYENQNHQSNLIFNEAEKEDIVSYLLKADNKSGKAKEFKQALSKAQKLEETRNISQYMKSIGHRKVKSNTEKNNQVKTDDARVILDPKTQRTEKI